MVHNSISLDLWSKIFTKLNNKDLYSSNLACKYFNNICKDIINNRFLKYKEEFLNSAIDIYIKHLLKDNYQYGFYNEYIDASLNMRKKILSNIIKEDNILNLRALLDNIFFHKYKQKWFSEITPYIFIFVLREWNNFDNDIMIKKLIIDYRASFKEKMKNYNKFNISYLDKTYKKLIEGLDNEQMNIIYNL